MKRIAAAICCLMLLCSCGGKHAAGSLPDVSLFNCNGYTTINDVMYSFYWERMSDSSYLFRFLAPASLEGYHVQCVGEEITVTYNGMELKNPQAITKDSFLFHLTAAVQSLSGSGQATCRSKDGAKLYSDEKENYTLSFDGDSGVLQSIAIKPLELTVEITDFQKNS